jgi:hypothetical protein
MGCAAGPCPGLGRRALGDWHPYGCHSDPAVTGEESRSALSSALKEAHGVGEGKNRARFLAPLGMTPGGPRQLARCRNFGCCPKGLPHREGRGRVAPKSLKGMTVGVAPEGQTMSSRGRSPRKTGEKRTPALKGPDYGSTPLGLVQSSRAISFRRLKPAATQGGPLRGHSCHLDLDGTLHIGGRRLRHGEAGATLKR